MKTQINARKMALTFGLLAASACLAPTPASAGPFHRRTVVVANHHARHHVHVLNLFA